MALVTVLMAVRDGAPFLGEAIASVLGQQGADFDVVIVDDGSTDDTAAILSSLGDRRVAVITNDQPRGLTVSLNRGLSSANGRFIARMDADDICLPGRLRDQVNLIESSGADICFGRSVDVEGKEIWKEKPWALIQWRGLFENAYGPHPAVLFRRSSIEAAGAYDEAFPQAQDYDLWDRCVASGFRFAYSHNPAIRYRRHAAAVTLARRSEQEALANRVSDRAMSRTFPDMDAEERCGLRWLMTGRGPRPEERTTAAVVRRCAERVESFSDRHAAGGLVWHDLSTRLFRRLTDFSPAIRIAAVRAMRFAAVRCLSPRLLVRSWRAGFMNRPQSEAAH